MKLATFLERLPDPFAVEILEALPGPDRKDLVRRHGAKVKVSAGNLKRAVRMQKEARALLDKLRKSEDLDAQRTFLQGWLARRADMIVHLLDAWEVQHSSGIVEDFDWVNELEADKVKASLEKLDEKLKEDGRELEPIAPLVYFAYLELPCTEQVLDVDALFAGVEATPA